MISKNNGIGHALWIAMAIAMLVLLLVGGAVAENSYEFVLKIPSSQQWNFYSPSGIAVDSSGNFYVANRDNDWIQKFSASGGFLAKWGSSGSGDGQFSSPRGIAVDSTGNVYVADSNNHRIQKFSASGVFTAISAGTTTITATSGSIYGTATATVTTVTPTNTCPQLVPPYCPNGTIISQGIDPNTGCYKPSICVTPTTPTPTTAYIAVDSVPEGASVFLDGIYKGTTPKLLANVSLGSHNVKLTLLGYSDWEYKTLAAAGSTSNVKATLTPEKDTSNIATELITATPTFTPLPTPTSKETSEILNPELLFKENWLLIGIAIIVMLFSIYSIIGTLRKAKSNASVIANEEPKPVAEPSEEPDSKSQAVLMEKPKEPPVEKPKEAGTISVKSAYEYRGAKIFYKIKIENNAIEPVGDIKVHLFVPDVFLLAEKEKAISMLETKESQTVTFEIRPTGECGECNVSGKIEYYDYSNKGRKMLDIENKSLSVICPVLKRKEIDMQQWEKVTDELIKAEEKIKELSAPAENLFNITSRVIKDNGMFMLKPEITSTSSLFNGLAMFYAEGVTGYRYAAYMEVVGGARKSRMILKVWAEKEEALIGFYHKILDDIEKRIDVKIFIDDTIVQQHIHIGDRIGTQVKDSVVQRSNIGAGERKCSECGREVEENEKFCNECGTRL